MNNTNHYKNMLEYTNTIFTDWECVIPDKLYYNAHSDFPYPVYYNWSDIADTQVHILLGVDTCQLCNYQNLTRLWIIKTKDSRFFTIVGSECWKKFSPFYQNSTNVINDMVYNNVSAFLLKHKDKMIEDYWNFRSKLWYLNLGRIGYTFSNGLKEFNSSSIKADVKRIIKAFTELHKKGFYKEFSESEMAELFVLINDKVVRKYWLDKRDHEYGKG